MAHGIILADQDRAVGRWVTPNKYVHPRAAGFKGKQLSRVAPNILETFCSRQPGEESLAADGQIH